jgi:Lon protease-like protein
MLYNLNDCTLTMNAPMTQLVSMPLFPLKTVLFPGMLLPLHIFEERYKTMVRECLEKEEPFGVVLIREGSEVGETPEPHRIGTSAIIARATKLTGERYNILSVGYQRFRVHSLSYEQPYLSGLVETLEPVDGETEEAYRKAQELRPHLQSYIRLLADITETSVNLSEMPDRPVLLAYVAAILLQVPLADKQKLLAIDTIPELLAREMVLLARERQLLDANIGTEYTLDAGESAFSAN